MGKRTFLAYSYYLENLDMRIFKKMYLRTKFAEPA